jgi:hypothetical protein
MYIENFKKTRSQRELTYLSKTVDVYDENKTKAKLIEDNIPKKPLVKNAYIKENKAFI